MKCCNRSDGSVLWNVQTQWGGAKAHREGELIIRVQCSKSQDHEIEVSHT